MKINFCATCSFEGKWDGCLSLVGCLPRLSFSFATYVNLIVSLSSYVYEFQEITISHSDAITLYILSTQIILFQFWVYWHYFLYCIFERKHDKENTQIHIISCKYIVSDIKWMYIVTIYLYLVNRIPFHDPS